MKKEDNLLHWSSYFDFLSTITIPFPLPYQIMEEFVEDARNTKVLSEPLPFLPLRGAVMFPHVTMPMEFSTPREQALLKHLHDGDGYFIATATTPDVKGHEEHEYDKYCYKVGVLCRLVRVIAMDEDSTQTIVLGLRRVRIHTINSQSPFSFAEVNSYQEVLASSNEEENVYLLGLVDNILVASQKNVSKAFDNLSKEIFKNLKDSNDLQFIINFAVQSSSLTPYVKQELLELRSIKARGERIFEILDKESQFLSIREDIRRTARKAIDRNQKDFFLQQQISAMQQELGGGDAMDSPFYELIEAAKDKKWSEETAQVFAKELRKLDNYNPQSPDYAVQYQYLQTLLELPWNEYSEDHFDLAQAQKILDRDHFGLEKIKERIIEHLAVLRLKKNMKSPILCLWGPPGVGKTSLGKSIAESLGRKYVRISLGGVHDEAEIRGHRRTYIGAMPGRIIQAVKKAGTANPVIVLDEIDKVSSDYKGDPSAALLEVLDPEQNNTFHDNYIDLDFDLSNVLFIATANTLSTISRPLLDRMELLELSGYITEEKIEIAKRHLVPHQLEEHGLKKTQAKFSNSLLEKIIEQYTRESGVRALEKQLAAAMRKIAKKVVAEEPYNVSIKESELKEYLGPAPFSRDMYQGNKYVGVVTGLAWTRVGGEILFIESSLHKGKDSRPTLTGNLGDVMKESAIIALNYTRAHAAELDIDPELFASNELHIHVPEGAIPKDGPSAGITMVTSIVSAFTQRLVRERIAMTGEITLRGKVLPVGGVKEKILAAKRAGITDIVLSSENKKDIDEINEIYTKGITFHYVDDIRQVLDFALLPKGKKQK
ncbi:endopeptidase La [Porphyromonas endodontalis]|uniref:endopeptidase La n=1 Tax=Porphyromonas endodontalis TaxID=28124 RepID=UPI003C7A21BD